MGDGLHTQQLFWSITSRMRWVGLTLGDPSACFGAFYHLLSYGCPGRARRGGGDPQERLLGITVPFRPLQ